MAAESFQRLEVWQYAHQLVLAVYRITAAFPNGEKFGLVSQMRRAAVSVAANIAEGYKRRGRRDKIRFYNLAECSLEELRYYLILSRDLDLVGDDPALEATADRVARMLNGLIKRVEADA
ncbi:MAG: four helix bundle protein [Chromatiales bacterium]|jgi:four helix bundle protein